MGEVEALEPWLDKKALAKYFACSVRWIEHRMVEGLPHRHIAGRAKFRASDVEPWLEARGFIERRGDPAPEPPAKGQTPPPWGALRNAPTRSSSDDGSPRLGA